MLNVECNGGRWPAGVKTRDGKLWFPTQDGVAVIDPEAMPSNPNPPPVVIESFLIDREPQAFDRPLRIPPGKANIEIQYTGLSFINSERLLFKYRLAGADDDWVEAGTRRAAYYSHVAPGHYTFTVLAANSDGLWNNIGASLAFTVLPAWHQTAWFRVPALVAVCGAALGFYRRRIARLEAQRAAQQEFSLRLIQSQEQERKRIAGELHDSLGQSLLMIRNRALLGLNPQPNLGTTENQLNEISSLAASALSEAREIAHNLRPYQLDELGFTRALRSMLQKTAQSARLALKIELEESDGLLPPEFEINLFRIVQECVNNIVRHSHASAASVILTKTEQTVRLLVEDNGCGFDATQIAKSTERSEGMGLRGIAERVRLMGGTLRRTERTRSILNRPHDRCRQSRALRMPPSSAGATRVITRTDFHPEPTTPHLNENPNQNPHRR
jgi:signal transduction histidine kinase